MYLQAFISRFGDRVSSGAWEAVESQCMYLQGCVLNLDQTLPGATTKPKWFKDREFHSIIRFLRAFC